MKLLGEFWISIFRFFGEFCISIFHCHSGSAALGDKQLKKLILLSTYEIRKLTIVGESFENLGLNMKV